MTICQEGIASAAHQALDAYATALDHLIEVVEDGGLADLDDLELVGFAQEAERVRNRAALVDHALVSAGSERDLPGRLCQRSMLRVLTSALGISTGEASRRVRAAEHLGPRRSMTGADLPPLRPTLAAAQREGDISTEKVTIIDRELRRVDGRGFNPADLEAGEQILTDAAVSLAPEQLRGLAIRVVEAIDPDGTVPDDEHQQDRRFFHLRTASDGSVRGEFRLTPEVGHKLKTILDSLAAPQPTIIEIGGDSDVLRHVEPDERTRDQRLHDALGQVCDRLLRSGTLPDTGGIPTTLILTIEADRLSNRTRHGTYGDGTPVSAAQVADLADQAGVAWCVRGSRGEVLALGRAKRLATPAQTLALIARDGGCSFPGCDTEPSWCERHHITSWIDGGPTDLDNLTLLCRYHHHNFQKRGWECELNANGLPAWAPPRWIDRQRRAVVNPRILARQRDATRQPPNVVRC